MTIQFSTTFEWWQLALLMFLAVLLWGIGKGMSRDFRNHDKEK